MIHCVQFSGGKDSTAVLLWMKEQGIKHRTVFCDTGWEHPVVYDYIREMNQKLSLGVEWLRSREFPNGFEELCMSRKMTPGKHARFCTKELKIEPLWEWIGWQEDEVTCYQGIRAEESPLRAKMKEREYVQEGGGYWIERPIFHWSVDDVFAILKKHGIKECELYRHGMKRVGCAPCIFANLPELRQWALRFPEVVDKVIRLEAELNRDAPEGKPRGYFRGDAIPQRFMRTMRVKADDGREIPIPTAREVFDYVTELDRRQLSLLGDEMPACVSIYNLCE